MEIALHVIRNFSLVLLIVSATFAITFQLAIKRGRKIPVSRGQLQFCYVAAGVGLLLFVGLTIYLSNS